MGNEYANSHLYSTSRSDTSANIALPSQITAEEQRKLEMEAVNGVRTISSLMTRYK